MLASGARATGGNRRERAREREQESKRERVVGEASAVWCGVVGKGREKEKERERERERERELWEKHVRCGVVWWGKGERELKIAEKRLMNRCSAQSECFYM